MEQSQIDFRRGWLSTTLAACLLAVGSVRGQDVPFDAVVEQADKWRVESADRVTVTVDSEHTHGTPRALHLAWKKDLGDLAGKGIPATPQVPRCWLELPADLDLSRFTRLTFWAKVTGTRHGHLHVAFGNKPMLWGQDLKRHINNSPLDAGEWSQHQVTLGNIDADERKTYRWMGIASINVGYQPDESPVMHVWLDDFAWTSKPIRKFRGWDADPTVVIVSQAGFRRFHEKVGVVDGQSQAEGFVVRD
ncbi:MAG: hypothetical protein FJ272_14650, partial [Planctomycetes bacterium]|nr:hypothetical protein [Planctomycetota bacterium]